MTGTPQVKDNAWPPYPLGSKALLRDGSGRLVLVKPGYNQRGWYLIGGGVDPGESFEQALIREIHEETGLDRTPERLLVVEQVAADTVRGKPAGLNLIFDVEPLAPGEPEQIRLPPHELHGVRLVDPADIDKWTLPLLARSIRAARTALDKGSTVLLPEHRPR